MYCTYQRCKEFRLAREPSQDQKLVHPLHPKGIILVFKKGIS